MNHQSIAALALLLASPLARALHGAPAPVSYEEELATDTAVIAVTGLKTVTAGDGGASQDLSVAEGASVRVQGEDGVVAEKKVVAFPRRFSNGQTFYTADFPVRIGAVYRITLTFANGVAINVDDFRLDPAWKRHHYFHWTTGYKTPASVLRRQHDEKSGRWCYIYSLFPVRNYIESGGVQVK